MTVARETSRRGGAGVAPDTATSVAAAAQARSAEVQRQLNLTVSEKKHFELVCEVLPDWNDNEIVSFLNKCNYNPTIINDALMNAFEDLRPSEDQSAADWNVQSKRSKRNKKDKVAAAAPGEPSSDRRHSGPRDRSENRSEKFVRRDRSERRKDQPFERRPKRDFSKPEGAAAAAQKAQQPQWSSCSWGEAQPTLPTDAGAWGDPVQSSADTAQGSLSATDPATPSPAAVSATPSAAAPSSQETSSSSHQDGIAERPSAPAKPTSSISWAGITKRSLEKPAAPKAESPKPAPESEAKAAPGWGSEEPTIGQWGAPEPAVATDSAPDVAPIDVVPEPSSSEVEVSSAPSEPEISHDALPSAPVPKPSPTDDLLTAPGPVILPPFVQQQQAVLNSTMIQFGTFSISDESEMMSPNAECVRIHSAQADFTQQQLLQQQEHEMAAVEDPTDMRNSRHEYVNEPAIPMHQFYPPFLNNMHSYMPYDADTSSIPAYFEPYNQQRVQRPRQQSYNNARNNKMRRDHRANNNQRQSQQTDESPAQAAASHEPAGAFAQGVPERDSQGPKSAGMESSSRSGTGGPRGNKQRQGDRSRGGLSGGYHHPSYAGSHIPVGYGQPYAYPAPYLPQFYGQNQQGYGPPGFRQHYSQYQNASNYQQPYQSGMPRSAYTEYVDTAGMHQANAFGQHQGEAGPTTKQSESEHVSPDQSVLYPFEHQAWPDQHRYVLQSQQPHQAQGNESSTTETASEGISLPHSSFDRRGDVSPSQSASFGYSGQQQYSQAHSYQNFSNQHQYNDSSNRSYPHWASHQ